MNHKWIAPVATLAILLVGVDHAALAQPPRFDTSVSVAARARARSAPFELGETGQVTVSLVKPPSSADGVVRVYVFNQLGVLSGMDDPEVPSDRFTYQPPAPGRYFVAILNTNSSPVTVRVETFHSPQTRRLPTRSNFATVRVLYATNRQRAAGNVLQFGTEPVANIKDMTYGLSDVSIPRDHRMGELEAPTIWRLELREDPARHVTVLATRSQSEADFYRQVGDRAAQSAGRQALVFVHGFNQSFDDAIKRTAQIAYDLAFDGPAITFSWPSKGGVLEYFSDQRNADVSAEALQKLLLTLKSASKQQPITVHVIAHSMGNRVLARALEQIGATAGRGSARPLREVAMIAPDVDAALFKQVAGKISASATRVTLYASSQDTALLAARKVAGYPRAGEGGPNVVVVSGVETVDASSVQTSMLGLGHSYYADNSTLLSDLFHLIRGRRPDERFGLEPVPAGAGRYWRFRPAK